MVLGLGVDVDLDAVRAAVGAVLDPELGRGLAELGMLGEISRQRGFVAGAVRVEVRLTTSTCPLADQLREAVTAAAQSIEGVRQIDVRLTAMTPRERVELAERLRHDASRLTDSRMTGAGALGGPVTTAAGRGAPQIYAVASGKGGVGKSTVTANLAVALQARGKRVGVIDADVWGYSMPQLFGVRRAPVVLGEQLMLPVPAHGVWLMSMGFFVTEEQPVVWRGPMLHKALQQFINDTWWPDLDVLLVDLPPGTGDATLSLLELLPEAMLLAVTTPQDAARTVATRVARMAAETGVKLAGVVENMSAAVCEHCHGETALFGSGGGERLAAEVGAPLLGSVPLDVELRTAGDRGVPVVAAHPESVAAQQFIAIADRLPVAARRSLLGRSLPLAVVGSPVPAAGAQGCARAGGCGCG